MGSCRSAQQAQNNAAAAAVHASIHHLREEESRQEVQHVEAPGRNQESFPPNHQFSSAQGNSHPSNPANVHSPAEFDFAGYK